MAIVDDYNAINGKMKPAEPAQTDAAKTEEPPEPTYTGDLPHYPIFEWDKN